MLRRVPQAGGARFRRHRLAQAAQLALIVSAAGALPAQAFTCPIDSGSVTGTVTLAENCEFDIGLTIGSKGSLTTTGTVVNRAQINTQGRIVAKGRFTNLGVVSVVGGGFAQIVNSADVVGGVLQGGFWRVEGVSRITRMQVGTGAISTNAADIEIAGALASFDQLSSLSLNQGHLTISQGHNFTAAALTNTGTITMDSGGTVAITKSTNFANNTLTGGRWEVIGAGGTKVVSSLSIGSGAIATNAADILLSGATAGIGQLSGLSTNEGRLAVAGGQSLTLGNVRNTGTMVALAGGNLTLQSSPSIAGKSLLEGHWEVRDNGVLAIGSGAIISNAADIQLSGSGASFAQIAALTTNSGRLGVADGAAYTVGVTGQKAINLILTNQSTGLIAVGEGSTVGVGTGSTLTNLGTVDNQGTLVVNGVYADSKLGFLRNSGALQVFSGGKATVAGAEHLADGRLSGGSWQVYGVTSTAALTVGSGDITTNAASVLLSGSKASFAQLSRLRTNEGALTIDGGLAFTLDSLANTGTVTVSGAGSSLIVAKTSNVSSKGVLEGGNWRVQAAGQKNSTLVLGGTAIVENRAAVTLSGAGSVFHQLDGLQSNLGELHVEGGRAMTLAQLNNTGFVGVATGGSLTINSPTNLANGILKGGVWDVNGTQLASSLSLGSASVTRNEADIRLRGASAVFTNVIDSKGSFRLTENAGDLTLSDGRNDLVRSLRNTGQLTVAAGSSVTITSSASRSTDTLLEGIWNVQGSPSGPSSLTLGTGSITSNKAEVQLSGVRASFDQLSGLRSNFGTLKIVDGNAFTVGQFFNTGTVAVGQGSSITAVQGASYSQKGGQTRVDGLLDAGNVVISDGSLSGTGLLRSSGTITIGSHATLAPGNSPGTLSLQGNVTLDGLLDIELASPTEFDVLNVSGALSFGNASLVRFMLGFTPTAGHYSFDFLHAGELVNNPPNHLVLGNADGYQSELACAAGNCSFNLTALAPPPPPAPVPEPENYALFLAGLGVLAVAARRRRR